ncbi:LysR substrate-binding domain-containing protein [Limosilactobacillus fermentum]|nr:LysR substrate-binding domain-containing protein [Limosilactobacillus fermentum]WNY96828.1 LysR substrate-binding domain-containing protein [Limosilactobacillus fermentum]BAW85895.1 LysR family transcriptional regulator [Limosilactobacillus fermentum]
MIGTFDQATTRRLVVAVPLGAYRFGIAVTSNHPLAHHSRLALNDLAGQHLLMVPRGISEKNDQLRDAIETAAPDVIIEGTRGRYNLDVFNRAADQNLALLNLTPTWSRCRSTRRSPSTTGSWPRARPPSQSRIS